MMQPTILYFVRHGETDANTIDLIQGQRDVRLNENGMKQAETVGKRMQNMKFDCIYSSDLSRAAFTAECIANGRKVIYTPRLREWAFGTWEGKTLDEISVIYPDEFKAYKEISNDFHPSGGESTMQLKKRAADFLEEMAAKHPGRTVLCVSHGGFIRNILQIVLKIERFNVRPRADNTAVSCFKTSDNGRNWQLITWNDTAHLQSDNMNISSGY